MKTIFALVVIFSATVANAQFYPSMSQLHPAPVRYRSATFVRSGPYGVLLYRNRPVLRTYSRGSSVVIYGGRRH